jgi:Ca2+-transporting ATPase
LLLDDSVIALLSWQHRESVGPVVPDASASTIASAAAPGAADGLTSGEATRRLRAHGPNLLVPAGRRRPPALVWAWRAVSDPMAVLLLAASAIYVSLGDVPDSIVTLAALVPITAVSLLLEVRAERALAGLRRLTAPTARTRRDGVEKMVPVADLVPGDVVLLQEGDVVPADGRLLQTRQLAVDESALTGESHPVDKDPEGGEEGWSVFAGTTVLSGRGVAVLERTGPSTRFGQIGRLVAGIRQPQTPLQRVIRRLILQLAAVALLFCVGVVAVELAYGLGWGRALIAGVSLAIAAVPEEFPMVFTLFLALGAWRLAREQALVRRLASVETLGATTVICTDKTGTLTMGDLTVAALAVESDAGSADEPLRAGQRALLEAAVLACEPRPFDHLEQAVLEYADEHGDVPGRQAGELVADYPFDPAARYMSHVWRRGGVDRIAAKGAVEGILEVSQASPATRAWAQEANRRLADGGMRVIAVAAGDLQGPSGDRERDERALRFRGLVGFSDPLRPGVREALAECVDAGIRVIMLTGDHPVTAHAVAEGLALPHRDADIATGDDLDRADDDGLADLAARSAIFARTRPEQKHRLVRALRSQEQVVAMTGDGINDAPALREADIGVAMGRRGTEVAREAAAMVLLDDNFATIVSAVRNGRRIFDNLRRAFAYLVAFHVPLLLAALVVPVIDRPLLLLPIHLVILELFIHPAVSLVFEAEPADPDLMRRPPRRAGGGLLPRDQLLRTAGEGVVLFAGVLIVYLALLASGAAEDVARAGGFACLLLGQLLLLEVERSPDRPLWRAWRPNRALGPIAAATLLALVLAVQVPALGHVLRLAPLSAGEWAAVVGVALVAALWREPVKALLQRPPTAPPAG